MRLSSASLLFSDLEFSPLNNPAIKSSKLKESKQKSQHYHRIAAESTIFTAAVDLHHHSIKTYTSHVYCPTTEFGSLRSTHKSQVAAVIALDCIIGSSPSAARNIQSDSNSSGIGFLSPLSYFYRIFERWPVFKERCEFRSVQLRFASPCSILLPTLYLLFLGTSAFTPTSSLAEATPFVL
nr:hypothetical protein Iba_chr01aCG16020 [Ipomoea batatas]GMC54969.1 hypothetical protein Iba_chr01eCG2970 [Ipomoea batatas]